MTEYTDEQYEALETLMDNATDENTYYEMLDIGNWSEDDGLLVNHQVHSRVKDLPRCESTEHGFVVYCTGCPDSLLNEALAMKEAGFSHDFVVMWYKAGEKGCFLINMDRG